MNWLHYAIGPTWAILGALVIMLYADYDHDRFYHAHEKFQRFWMAVFLFGLATGVFVLHLVNVY